MSVNNVMLVGHLGAAPELRQTRSGKSVCTFSVATNRRGAREDEEEITEWHRVVVWDRSAELCHRYLAKGRMVAVEGRLQTRSWQDPDGRKRYMTEVVAFRVTFLGGRGGTPGSDRPDAGPGPAEPPPREPPAEAPAAALPY